MKWRLPQFSFGALILIPCLSGPSLIQARVITNLEHLNVEEANTDTGEKVPMPELQHNMKLLVDIAEADIKRLDANLRQKEDSAVCVGTQII